MSKDLEIIVVDDDNEDKQLLQFAFSEANVKNPVNFIDSGEELFEYLKPVKVNSVGIILLDLNMPRMDGREVLRNLKQNAEWKRIPVIIFSTSNSESDISETYALGASSYMVKPLSYARMVSLIRVLNVYWFESIVLPNQ